MCEPYVFCLFLDHGETTFHGVEKALRKYYEGVDPVKEIDGGVVETLRMYQVSRSGDTGMRILTEWKFAFTSKNEFYKYKLKNPAQGANIQKWKDEYSRLKKDIKADILALDREIDLREPPEIDMNELLKGL